LLPNESLSQLSRDWASGKRPRIAGQEQIEVWPMSLELAQSLPVLPRALNAELAVPVDLEATYTIAWHRRRLARW
jgi:hypothetical protein